MGHEAASVPKPMVRVGGYPVIWHIMKVLHNQGIKEFVICAGHKGDIIRDYFLQYAAYRSNLTISYSDQGTQVSLSPRGDLEDWTVHVVETGETTPTGGRILSVQKIVGDEDFVVTYGDGIADVDMSKVVETHKNHSSHLTVSTAKPRNRFGVLEHDGAGRVTSFEEKPQGRELVNIGYMVASNQVFNYLTPDSVFEAGPIRDILSAGKLSAVQHLGFWQPMDTPAELASLNKLWEAGTAPWAKWN